MMTGRGGAGRPGALPLLGALCSCPLPACTIWDCCCCCCCCKETFGPASPLGWAGASVGAGPPDAERLAAAGACPFCNERCGPDGSGLTGSPWLMGRSAGNMPSGPRAFLFGGSAGRSALPLVAACGRGTGGDLRPKLPWPVRGVSRSRAVLWG